MNDDLFPFEGVEGHTCVIKKTEYQFRERGACDKQGCHVAGEQLTGKGGPEALERGPPARERIPG